MFKYNEVISGPNTDWLGWQSKKVKFKYIPVKVLKIYSQVIKEINGTELGVQK